MKQVRLGISRSMKYVGVLVGIMEIWKMDLRNIYFSILYPSPVINLWVSLVRNSKQRTLLQNTCHSTVSGIDSQWKATQRTNGIFHWWRSLTNCRRPQFLSFPEGRLPCPATFLIPSPGPRTWALAQLTADMNKHFNPNAPFKMAQDVSLIQYFHKMLSQWHLWKAKRLLFMTVCADHGYGT